MSYLRRKGAGAEGIVYVAEFSIDLAAGGWEPGGEESVEPVDDVWERVTVSDVGEGVTRFARVKVEIE